MKGSAVLIIDDQNRLLILLRAKEAHWMPHKWGLPGGRIERGENSAGAAVRETKEETDLNLWTSDLTSLRQFNTKHVDLFYATNYTGTVHIDFEHEDFKWVTREEIEKYDTTPNLVEMFDWVLQNER
jgi:phosphoglycolate phosphatase|tara:strand:- start:796 stop:1176 length:381 start_codon:yes stop_codon:yes gene_type:complete